MYISPTDAAIETDSAIIRADNKNMQLTEKYEQQIVSWQMTPMLKIDLKYCKSSKTRCPHSSMTINLQIVLESKCKGLSSMIWTVTAPPH